MVPLARQCSEIIRKRGNQDVRYQEFREVTLGCAKTGCAVKGYFFFIRYGAAQAVLFLCLSRPYRGQVGSQCMIFVAVALSTGFPLRPGKNRMNSMRLAQVKGTA